MKPIRANCYVVVAGISAAMVAAIFIAQCGAKPVAAASGSTAEPIAVQVARVAMAAASSPIDAGGVVEASTTATITARLLAPVREVLVSPGEHVRKGQTLIVLDSRDLAAGARSARSAALAAEEGAAAAASERDAAEARLVLARASHERVASLAAKRSATAQELDDAVAALRSAEAGAASAAARMRQAAAAVESAKGVSDEASTTESFATIAAPFDGTVTEKMVEPGNMVSPGLPLLRLEDTRGFRLEVRVDESLGGRIQNGDRVPVILGNGEESIAGTVVEVSRSVDADARAFLVKIAMPVARGIRSGAFGKAQFPGAARRALIVPAAAVVRRGQLTTVFVVDNGVARVRLVSVSGSEALAGLSEQEMVIVSPPPGVTDGRRVRPGGGK